MIHPAVSIASSTAPAAVSLLQTTAIEHELHPEDEIVQVDFGDLSRPHYYDRAPPSHPVMDSLSPGSQDPNTTEPL